MHRSLIPFATIAAIAAPSASSAAGPESFTADYSVTFLGIPVARASFTSRYEGTSYSIDGSVSSAGMAQIFDDTKGTIRASGQLSDSRLRPQSFRADYTSAKKASLVDIRFSNGTVASTKVIPAPKKRGNDWTPLRSGDLAGVADPITATVVRAESLDDVCNQTVKMYDGEMRSNLRLSYASTGSMAVKGYDGPTITCRMGFEPVSGYLKGRKALEFLKNRSKIMVTFAPLGQTGVYAPIYATVGTEIGTITIKARRFEAEK